jgi:predicted short-subunit dehydrogenase-like oxidoreductase (DUF2520 family)
MKNAVDLSQNTDAEAIDDASLLYEDLDLVILAVRDDVLKDDFLETLPKSLFIVHTSGSVEMSAMRKFTSHGVFYPLQTFSKTINIDFTNIPICLEANNKKNLELLKNIASCLSHDIREIDSNQRKQIHVAAVFACNFVNYLFHISETILDEKKINLDILLPLIEETIRKIRDSHPSEVQTGPAKRKDENVLQKHIEMLADYPDYQTIYTLLSKKIMELS